MGPFAFPTGTSIPMPHCLRPVASQNVAVTTTSAASAAVDAFTQAVRLAATADCYVTFGSNPTATTTGGMLIRASTAGELFKIKGGEKIAAICGTGTATLNITEMSA